MELESQPQVFKKQNFPLITNLNKNIHFSKVGGAKNNINQIKLLNSVATKFKLLLDLIIRSSKISSLQKPVYLIFVY